MERVSMTEDTILLRNPVTLDNGQVITELPVKPGQASIHSYNASV